MFRPIILRRIFRLNAPIHRPNDDTFLNTMLECTNRPPKRDIPLGRWCGPSSEKYKDKCKPDIKVNLEKLEREK